MKCPNCKGHIAGDYKGKTCSSCGEPLPIRRHILLEWSERVVGFTSDRGFFFWLIVLALLLFFVAALEHLFFAGEFATFLDEHKFLTAWMLFYAAAHLKIIRHINETVRPGYPGPYWTDRLIIKKFKKGTNLSLMFGFILSLLIILPCNLLGLLPGKSDLYYLPFEDLDILPSRFDVNFFNLLPFYALVISLCTALYWSIAAFRVDDREFTDAKVQTYFSYLGIRKLRDWRKTSGAYMIVLVICIATFYGLLHIPNLWKLISENPTLKEIIDIFNGLFNWVPQIMEHAKK